MNDVVDGLADGLVAPTRSGIATFLIKPIEIAAAALLLILISLVLIGVVFRYVVSSPIIWIDEAAGVTFLWLSMIGAVIAIDRGEHLRLTLFLRFVPTRLLPFVHTCALVIMGGFLLALIKPAVDHTAFEAIVTLPGLEISQAYRVAAIAFGFILMFAITLAHIFKQSRPIDILASIVLIVCLCTIFWLQKPFLTNLGQGNILIFLVGMSGLCLVLGVHFAARGNVRIQYSDERLSQIAFVDDVQNVACVAA